MDNLSKMLGASKKDVNIRQKKMEPSFLELAKHLVVPMLLLTSIAKHLLKGNSPKHVIQEEYSLSGAAGVTADMTIDASDVIVTVKGDDVVVDGQVITTIDDLTLKVSVGSIEGSIACSGKLIYDNFEDGTLTCDNADVSCVVGYNNVSQTFDCDEINTIANEVRSIGDRGYCSASEPASDLQNLVELALMKIEEAVREREEESSEE